MRRPFDQLLLSATMTAGMLMLTGCGTTRSSDTSRTATEQLLISDAIDRAVESMDLQSLSGQTVFLDDSRLGEVVDRNYLTSTLRQHLLANGCHLRDKREDAEFVVEARAGAVGTDRNDLLFGVPSMNVPQILPMQPVPAAIPEIPFAKRKHQRGIAKLAVFVYHRSTGAPVWQSGLVLQESSSNDVWILGAGPFQRGTIHSGTAFAGKTLGTDEAADDAEPKRLPPVEVARETTFTRPQELAQKQSAPPVQPGVIQAAHAEPAPMAEPNASTPMPATAPAPQPAETSAPAVPTAATSAPSVYASPPADPLPQPRFEPLLK